MMKVRFKSEDLYVEGDPKDVFLNSIKFPLTMVGLGAEEMVKVFSHDTITFNDKEYDFKKYIKYVYAPVHIDDGGSGRSFGYPYNRDNYYDILNRLSEHVDISITFPRGGKDTMERYINLGVTNFMVTEWDNSYHDLKLKYPNVEIMRSIVGNSYNRDFDDDFDGYIIPNRDVLNWDVLSEVKSIKKSIAILPNLGCKVTCDRMDEHLNFHIENGSFDSEWPAGVGCPKDTEKSFFIPRELVFKLLKDGFVDTVKLTDRGSPLDANIALALYFIYGEAYPSHKNYFRKDLKVMNNWLFSNMVTLDCKFDCLNCDKKCY